MTYVLNQEVNVTGYHFTKGKSFPSRIEFGDDELNFAEIGLRCLVKKGQELIEVFTMSDGRDTYTIRHNRTNQNWILLSKRALA